MLHQAYKSLCHHFLSPLGLFAEEILLLMVSEIIAGSLDVKEHAVSSADVNKVHFAGLSLGCKKGTSRD